jgi:CelD/BcsL family acetyltransferase involved in cellulose biosynthesis
VTAALPTPETLSDDAAIAAFDPAWRLFVADHASSPFDSPDWLRPWYRHYRAGGWPRLLVWRLDGRVVGVAPLIVRRSGGLVRRTDVGLWGGSGPAIRGLVGVVATDEHRDAVLDGLADWLSDGREPWDVLHLLRLPVGSAVPSRLQRAAERLGWRMVSLTGVVRSTTYVIDLRAGQPGRQDPLGAKARHNLRTEAHRFERAGGRFERIADPSAAAEAVAAIRRLMTGRWGGRELNFAPDPAFEPFLIEALGAMIESGSLHLDLARDHHGIRACLATMILNRRAVALVVGVSQDDDVRRMSLGKQLFARSIGEAVRRGCLTYDFLWAGDYKESFWHAIPRTMESLVVGRGLRGRSVAEAVWLRRRALPSLVRLWSGPR